MVKERCRKESCEKEVHLGWNYRNINQRTGRRGQEENLEKMMSNGKNDEREEERIKRYN